MVVVGVEVEVEVEKQGATCGAYTSVYIFMAVSPPIWSSARIVGRHFTCSIERLLFVHGYLLVYCLLGTVHRHYHPCVSMYLKFSSIEAVFS
jgi:hypothetical protein